MRLPQRAVERNRTERTGARQKLRREISVRTVMGKKDGQRSLRIGPSGHRNVGGFAGGGASPIGCDHQGRPNLLAGREPSPRETDIEIIGGDLPFKESDVGGFPDRRGERVNQRIIRNVDAEPVEADLTRLEADLGRGEERAGVIDDADAGDAASRGFLYAEPCEKPQRSLKQRNRAPGNPRLNAPDKGDAASLARHCERGAEPSRSGAGDEDIGLERTLRHFSFRVRRGRSVKPDLSEAPHSGTMVVRTRLRAIVLPLVLYTVSGSVAAYFVWHALNGERGLKASLEYSKQISDLEKERASLRAERAHWEHRIGLIRGDEIDRDLLDQEARRILGRVNAHDLVVMIPGQK